MPYLAQILLQSMMTLKAKRSILSKIPEQIWDLPNNLNLQLLHNNDWLNPHKIYTLTFIITRPYTDTEIFHAASFYYVDPRWQLTTPIEIELNKILALREEDIQYNLISPAESLYYINPIISAPCYINWQFLKQNDINMQYLIVESVLTNTPFFIPYSDIKIIPLGITSPMTSPNHKFKTYINIDPTSDKYIFKGHDMCT